MKSRVGELLQEVLNTWDAREPEHAFDKLFDYATTGLGAALGALGRTNRRLILELRSANPRSAEWRAALDDLVRVVEETSAC